MQVNQLLPKVKANSKTFKNIDGRDKQMFKRAYDYLKAHKDKEVNKIVETLINDYLKPIDMDFLIKYRAINFISTNIKH